MTDKNEQANVEDSTRDAKTHAAGHSAARAAGHSAAHAAGHSAARAAVPRYSFYALGVLSLVNFLNYIDRQVLPAVAPIMLQDPALKLTDAELGYMEASLLLSFTILAPLFGRLGDRYPRAKLMASAAVLWSIATAMTGLVESLPFLPGSVRLHVPVVN